MFDNMAFINECIAYVKEKEKTENVGLTWANYTLKNAKCIISCLDKGCCWEFTFNHQLKIVHCERYEKTLHVNEEVGCYEKC